MSKEELLKKFREEIKKLRLYANESDISENEVEEIFQNGLLLLKNSKTSLPKKNYSKKANFLLVTKCCLIIVTILILLYILLNVHQPTSSIVLRNVQGLIHPGFKFLRFFSVPIIKMFPSLTSKCLAFKLLSV